MLAQKKQPIQYYQVTRNHKTRIEAKITAETPVSLTVNGESWITFMCTPTRLKALGVGFLFNEGLIHSFEDIASIRLCAQGQNIDIWLNHHVEMPTHWHRTSGCTGGVTSSLDYNSANIPRPLQSDIGHLLESKTVNHLISLLFESQDLYCKTGGVHTSALSDGEKIHLVAEDIGRHNTLDKLSGMRLIEGNMIEGNVIEGNEISCRVLLTTGRISSEMIQKAARIGANIVISRTSPTSLSIQLARQWDITLIGYARRDRFNIYTHPDRIKLTQKKTRHKTMSAVPKITN